MGGTQKIDLYENFKSINSIDAEKYKRYDVKRGLRNADGTGVLAGLTGISNVHGYVMSDGEKRADEGELRLRGYDLYDLLGVDAKDRRFNYEEVSYLLLMGELPTEQQLSDYIATIDAQRELPDGFTASMIMRDTPPDIMNVLARTILLLFGRLRRKRRGSIRPARNQHRHLPYLPSPPHHGADVLRDSRALQQRVHDHASFHPGSVHGGDHSVHAAPRQAVHA